jgi:pyruvate/2-oxoglutarate/acetoin dehydrogenase E1 component
VSLTYIVQERAFDFLDAPIQRITTADTPAPYSPVLLKEWLPNADDVIKAVKKLCINNTINMLEASSFICLMKLLF